MASDRRVYRRNEHRLGGPPFVLVFAALFVIPVIFGSSPVYLLGAIPFIWIAYRIFRIGVFVDDSGVTIRDIFSTKATVPWEKIERFDWGKRRGHDFGGLYLTDGTFVAATALEAPWGSGKAVPKALAGLNEELARHRMTPPAMEDTATTPVETVGQLSLPTN